VRWLDVWLNAKSERSRMITDEMVDVACQAWLESASDYTRLHLSIRAALEAVYPLIAKQVILMLARKAADMELIDDRA